MVLERTLGMMDSDGRAMSTILDIGVSNAIVANVDMEGGEKVTRRGLSFNLDCLLLLLASPFVSAHV